MSLLHIYMLTQKIWQYCSVEFLTSEALIVYVKPKGEQTHKVVLHFSFICFKFRSTSIFLKAKIKKKAECEMEEIEESINLYSQFATSIQMP